MFCCTNSQSEGVPILFYNTCLVLTFALALVCLLFVITIQIAHAPATRVIIMLVNDFDTSYLFVISG